MMHKRTKWKMILSLLLAGAFLLTGCSQAISDAIAQAAKTDTEPVEQTTAEEVPKLRPEDDFYGYYGYDTLMSWKLGKYPQYSPFIENMDQIEKEQDAILDEVTADDAVWDKGTPEYEIATFYRLMMDMDSRDSAGVEALLPAIDAIQSASDINAFVKACGDCYRNYGIWIGLPIAIGRSVLENKNEIMITQPNFVASVKDLTGEDATSMMNAVQSTMVTSMRIWGTERKAAEQQCDKTAQMLGQIAGASMDADTLRDFFDYEYLSKKELSKLFDNIDTEAMLEAYGLSDRNQFTLMDRGCIETLNDLLTDENLEAWKTYALYSLYEHYAEVCDSPHRNPSVGGESRVPDEKLARNMIKQLYKEELAYLWSVQYVPEGTKESAQKLVTDIRDQMREHILTLDWMSEETREGALQKIDQMGLCVAYPDEWESNYQCSDYSMKSKEEGGQLLTEIIQYNQYEAQEQRKRLDGFSDTGLWGDTAASAADVNCYYNAQDNHIYILSGMLREPFFSVDNSYEENLGGIGMVIGHEITHGFDSQGARFDADGFYHDWWTKEDKEHFDGECDRIADYYDKYRILDIYHVDGRNTLTENIADLGGLSLISDVCSNNRQDLQTMYQSYVNVWMSLESEAALVDALKTDVHSPAETRVNAVLSNTDRFYDAYDIAPEDKMYIPKEDRVGIW